MIKVFRFLAAPVLAGFIVALLVLLWAGNGNDRSSAGMTLRNPQDTYAGAVNEAAPAVVNIYTTQIVTRRSVPDDPFFNRFMEEPRRERALSSLGSGVIVRDSGHVLTSYHVISNADEILVALRDGREAPAQVVGTDPETDLALLKINMDDLPVMKLDAPGKVRVGDVVLAIGNPLGVGQTVSMGIVSATGRSNLGIATFENFIQTDAAINRGNSGGALIDTDGDLIGINTAIISSDGSWEGIGFATPVSIARTVMEDLIEHGRVIRGWLGVATRSITPALAGSFNLQQVRGGLISEVVPGSPAHESGVKPGDVLVGINGEPVSDGYEAMNIIAGTRPGTRVELNLIRLGEKMTLPVTVGTRPQVE